VARRGRHRLEAYSIEKDQSWQFPVRFKAAKGKKGKKGRARHEVYLNPPR